MVRDRHNHVIDNIQNKAEPSWTDQNQNLNTSKMKSFTCNVVGYDDKPTSGQKQFISSVIGHVTFDLMPH